MRKLIHVRTIRLGLLAAISILILAGCASAKAKQAAPELIEPVMMEPKVIEVKRGSIANELKGVGVVVPNNIQYTSFTTSGKIASIEVEVGDRVRRGDRLMTLDRSPVLTNLLSQRLKVEKAKQALSQAKESQDQDRIKIAGMTLEIEEMKLEDLEEEFNQMEMFAPVDGTVVFVDQNLKVGSTVQSYRKTIGIAQDHDIQVKYISNSSLRHLTINVGDEVKLFHKGKEYTGKVVQTPNSVPFTSNDILAELNTRMLIFEFDQVPADAEFGDMVEFVLVMERADDVIVIPRVALRSYNGRNFVRILDGDTRKEVDVQRGMQTATQVEIVQGLKEGQLLIVN